jgi:hypothetical protein
MVGLRQKSWNVNNVLTTIMITLQISQQFNVKEPLYRLFRVQVTPSLPTIRYAAWHEQNGFQKKFLAEQ